MSSFDRGLNYMASSNYYFTNILIYILPLNIFICSFTILAGTKLANPNGAVSTEQLWQAFFANPVDWWDNRKNKVIEFLLVLLSSGLSYNY